MTKTAIDLRLLAGTALTALMLSACNAPEGDPPEAASPSAAPAAAATVEPVTTPAQNEIEDAAQGAKPTGPVNPMVKQMVTMGAGLFAAEKACFPDRAADMDAARATNRKAMGGMSTGMSGGQVDAMFDAAYTDAERKLEALSAADLSRSCAELEASAKAAAAAVGQ